MAPSASVGAVDLAVTSAGGDAGRWLTGGWLAATAWLLTLPAGFTLLWPHTAARALRATPGEAARDGVWIWRHGPRQALAALATRLRRFGEPDVPDLAGPGGLSAIAAIPEVLALDPFHARRAASANGDCGEGGCGADHAAAEAAAALDEAGSTAGGDEDADELPAVQMPMDLEHEIAGWRHSSDGWQLPPIDALHEAEPAASEAQNNARRADLIVETLASLASPPPSRRSTRGPPSPSSASSPAGTCAPAPSSSATPRAISCSTRPASPAPRRSRSRARASASTASPRSPTTSRSRSPRPRCASRRPSLASR